MEEEEEKEVSRRLEAISSCWCVLARVREPSFWPLAEYTN